ncbi:MAG: DUF2073 domain-containing protein [Candidatus Nanohalobium sp.]
MTDDGVTIEFLSKEKLTEQEFEDKLKVVLEKVKDNAVLVLEEAWTPEEKSQLIQNSMEQVDEDFPGVEFLGLNAGNSRLEKAKRMLYKKVLNEDYRRGLTIVGNSRVMEKIKEEKDTVSFLAKLEDENS